MKLDQITCCVVDNGLFIHVARRLSREYKKVYYWSPADRAFPTCRERCVGDGYPDIERVESIWDVKGECDLFVFPDIGFSGLQKELVSQGYPVWGCREGDALECNRGKFLKMLEGTDLPVPDYEMVKGLSKLTDYLKDKEDLYIKVSCIRGDFETFHWRSFGEDETLLCSAAVKPGPCGSWLLFACSHPSTPRSRTELTPTALTASGLRRSFMESNARTRRTWARSRNMTIFLMSCAPSMTPCRPSLSNADTAPGSAPRSA